MAILSGFLFASWTPPYLPNQPQLPAEQILRENAAAKEKKPKSAIREQVKCAYLAHQKNRLAYFADHDGFIWFDNKENKYSFFLSNFYPINIKMWEMKFYCSEAAFQAAKFLDKPEVAVRFTHLDGEDAWKLAQKLSYQQRGNWYKVRENMMLDVLRAKFEQHPELAELLLATGDAYLVENTDRDAFWADGGDGKGKNRLGHLLMKVREELGGIGVVPKPDKYKHFVD